MERRGFLGLFGALVTAPILAQNIFDESGNLIESGRVMKLYWVAKTQNGNLSFHYWWDLPSGRRVNFLHDIKLEPGLKFTDPSVRDVITKKVAKIRKKVTKLYKKTRGYELKWEELQLD